jgi:hypothetical protein
MELLNFISCCKLMNISLFSFLSWGHTSHLDAVLSVSAIHIMLTLLTNFLALFLLYLIVTVTRSSFISTNLLKLYERHWWMCRNLWEVWLLCHLSWRKCITVWWWEVCLLPGPLSHILPSNLLVATSLIFFRGKLEVIVQVMIHAFIWQSHVWWVLLLKKQFGKCS